MSSNSDTSASELLENLEEMFPLYYMDSNIIRKLKSQPHNDVLPVAKGLNIQLHNSVLPRLTNDMTKQSNQISFAGENIPKCILGTAEPDTPGSEVR